LQHQVQWQGQERRHCGKFIIAAQVGTDTKGEMQLAGSNAQRTKLDAILPPPPAGRKEAF